jgi:hypothetical protein
MTCSVAISGSREFGDERSMSSTSSMPERETVHQ